MNSKAETVEAYIKELPNDRLIPVSKLRLTILNNLPTGFKEVINYGMISYVIPHEMYPHGYHCTPNLPLPFISIASQKNSINLYHMGIYSMPNLLDWFVNEYPRYSNHKLDMGKSCIRFKKFEQIPLELIAHLVKKISAEEWIACYEKNIKP